MCGLGDVLGFEFVMGEWIWWLIGMNGFFSFFLVVDCDCVYFGNSGFGL